MVEDSLNDGKTIDQPVGGKDREGKLSPGTMLGQYRIIRLLGRGGMGEVYEVEHRVLQRRYALKLIPDELVRQKGFLERFEREARVMAHLEHTHIVKVDDFGETGGRYWLRMELIEGLQAGGQNVRTLAELAEYGEGKIEQGLLANVLAQVLDGLSYAHDKGAIHRDLKPANILLTGKDPSAIEVKISDFGLVRLVGEEWVRSRAEQSVSISMSLGDKETEADKDKSGTSTRSLLGTYEYMSPEQKRGEEVDSRSDLYAVGLMAFRLLTGQREVSFELPSEIDNRLVKEWDGIAKMALQPVRDRRFGSANEMTEAVIKVKDAVNSHIEEEKRQELERRRKEEARQIEKERKNFKEEVLRKGEESERIRREYEEKKRQEAEEQRRKEEEERKRVEEKRLWREAERQRQEAEQNRKRAEGKKILTGVVVVLAIVGIVIGIGVNKARQQRQRVFKPTTEQRVSSPPVSEQKVSALAPTAERGGAQSEITNSIGMKFVLIKAGEFQMGSPSSEEKRDSDETQHKVTLTEDYYLQTTEVTRGQFAKFVKDTGYKTDAEKEGFSWGWDEKEKKWVKKEGVDWHNPGFDQNDEHPIVCVSWNDAVAFCEWLTKKEGKDYRLPTEAEWEYACRGGTTTAYQWGNSPDEGSGWCNGGDKEYWSGGGEGTYFEWKDGYKYTSPAGTFKPNKFGLYDMHGNVWEWCSDWYGEYTKGDATDPTGPSSGSYRVVRGGSWIDDPENVRSARRGRGVPDSRRRNNGFRCARTP